MTQPDAYRASLALGGSDIRAMVADFERWHFERKLIEAGTLPEWMQRDPSPAAEFGTLVHRALLEPWHHAKDVVMPYVKSFALKEGKAIKAEAEAQAEHQGGIVIRHEHGWALEHIKANFQTMAAEMALGNVTTATTEVEVWGVYHGINTKGKLDWLHHDELMTTLIDLKTISDWSKRNDVLYASNYHCQLAHYGSMAPAATAHGIVWIESVAPYRVEYQEVPPATIQLGLLARNKALDTYIDRRNGVKRGPFG
jgi:hypothetical protein